MRTTLTIDDDIAAKLSRLAKGRRLKEVTNRALRLGLQAMESKNGDPHYETIPVQGKPIIRNLDNVAEIIAETEGEDWR